MYVRLISFVINFGKPCSKALMRFDAVNKANESGVSTIPFLLGGTGIAFASFVAKSTGFGLSCATFFDRMWTSVTYNVLGICGVPLLRFETSLAGHRETQLNVEDSFFTLLLGVVIPAMLPLSPKRRLLY